MPGFRTDTYVDRLCYALIDELDDSYTSPPSRRAELAANLDFWIAEIEHRLELLNGYHERFVRSTIVREQYPLSGEPDNIRTYASICGASDVVDNVKQVPLRRRDLNGLRSELLRAVDQFLQQCVNDKLINKTTRKAMMRQMKIGST